MDRNFEKPQHRADRVPLRRRCAAIQWCRRKCFPQRLVQSVDPDLEVRFADLVPTGTGQNQLCALTVDRPDHPHVRGTRSLREEHHSGG
jgi:hypothetical protein